MMSKKKIILNCAATLFARQGFRETSMAEISKMSGVASATVFYHYKSKEELFIAILEQVKASLFEAFADLAETRTCVSGYDAVEGVVNDYLRLATDMPDAFLLLHRHFPYQLADANEDCRTHLEEVYNCLVGFFEDAIRQGREDGSIAAMAPHKTALILFSTVDGIVRFNTYKLYDAGTLYPELMACCGRMLQPPEKRSEPGREPGLRVD